MPGGEYGLGGGEGGLAPLAGTVEDDLIGARGEDEGLGGVGRKRKRSRANETGSSEWQRSRRGGIGILESVEVAEGADDAVASLGEILKSFHDGGAELPPIGGVVVIGGGRGAGARIGFSAPGGRGGWSRVFLKNFILKFTRKLV